MKKAIFQILIILSLLVLAIRFGSQPLLDFLGYQPKAGLKITSVPSATVFINDHEVGSTPYQNENLKPGEYKVKLKTDSALWQNVVKINSGTLSVVNREMAASIASSSGEILTLHEGLGVTLASNPTGSQVEIDGKVAGKTPLEVTDLSVGEHTFLFSHEGYLSRSIRAALPPKMNLAIEVDLAMSEMDLSLVPSPNITSTPLESKVIISQTPTGFLRVRNKPSTSGTEVGRVKPGDSLTLEEELTGWFKIKLNDGTVGYISSQYAKKQ
ncbi:MAG: PEGA domain-containing protein [Candidatus Daviesbacteria bacterium]